MAHRFTEWITSDKPGVIQAGRVDGFTTRPANQIDRPDEPATYRVELIWGDQSTAAIGAGQTYSTTGSKLTKSIEGISEIFLSQIQWDTISGITAGDGYCRFRLAINGQDMFLNQLSTNTVNTAKTGFVLLLNDTIGQLTFNPPLHLQTYKGAQGLLTEAGIIEVAVQDAKGQARTAQQISMVLLANSKYYM